MSLLADELGSEVPTGKGRPALETLVDRAEQLAAAASGGALDDGQVAELDELIDSVDALVDAWRYERAE
jgi:hypothetical protein